MKARIAITALMATTFILVLAGCGQTREETTAHAEGSGDSTATAADANGTAYDAAAAAQNPEGNGSSVPADNTGINARDRNDANPTADDQSHSPADLDLTRRIRDAIVEDDSLSINGKNVKIVARDGMVTLRGPVKDENERKLIGDKAEKIAGPGRVVNNLEVAR